MTSTAPSTKRLERSTPSETAIRWPTTELLLRATTDQAGRKCSTRKAIATCSAECCQPHCGAENSPQASAPNAHVQHEAIRRLQSPPANAGEARRSEARVSARRSLREVARGGRGPRCDRRWCAGRAGGWPSRNRENRAESWLGIFEQG